EVVTTETSHLSLHDALPIWVPGGCPGAALRGNTNSPFATYVVRYRTFHCEKCDRIGGFLHIARGLAATDSSSTPRLPAAAASRFRRKNLEQALANHHRAHRRPEPAERRAGARPAHAPGALGSHAAPRRLGDRRAGAAHLGAVRRAGAAVGGGRRAGVRRGARHLAGAAASRFRRRV